MDDDNPTVYEDLGYRGNAMKEPGMNRQRVRPGVEVKRILYTQGMMKDKAMVVNATIADDLIQRGFAIEVDREPGQEG